MSTLAIDLAPIAPGANEELAGPPHTATAPVQPEERISSIDVLRGFSLMGILIMNITDFGLGYHNYAFPLSTIKPVFSDRTGKPTPSSGSPAGSSPKARCARSSPCSSVPASSS